MLAYQRYGRGKALAMPIQDSWIWRMDAKMRGRPTRRTRCSGGVWSAGSSTACPIRSTSRRPRDRVEPGEPIKLTAEVLDPAYVEVNDSRVVAQRHVAVGQDDRGAGRVDGRRKDGDYRATLRARRTGHLRRSQRRPPTRDQKELGTAAMHVRVSAGDAEYFDAAMRAPLLKRIAEETGGRFFTPANAASLPEAISYSGRGVTVVEERELWDMPALFLAADRPGRRRVGLPAREGPGVSTTIATQRPREHRSSPQSESFLCVLCVLCGSSWSRLCCVLCAAPAFAQQTHLLVITGVAGDEEHAQKFQKWATAFIDAAKKKDARPRREHHAISRTSRERDAQGRRREGVRRHRGARAKPNDEVVVLLIGHGSFDGTRRAFNLPGPDLDRRRLGEAARQASAQRVAFVNTASSSGAFLPAAGRAGPRRSSPRPRPAASATRRVSRVLRRGLQRRRRRPRPQRPRLGRSKRSTTRRRRSTQAFRAEGLHAHRARHARRRRRADSWRRRCFSAPAARTPRCTVDTSRSGDARAGRASATRIERQIAALQLKKTVDGRRAQYDAQMEKLLTDLALKTKAIRDLQAKKAKP